MELKDIVKEHLVNEKEQERLKKIEENSKLEKVTLLTNGTPYCDTIKKHLDQEGISYVEKTLKDNPDDINQATSITNLGMFPIVHIKDNYIVYQRDFQNPQQLVQVIKHFANPNYKNSKVNDVKVLEHLKTTQYHIWTKLNNLEKQLSPVLNILTKLTEELEEDNE
tara:strand:- start:28 stop:525 length:498 start_codon:yes stop_codon:yes gene_type:complete